MFKKILLTVAVAVMALPSLAHAGDFYGGLGYADDSAKGRSAQVFGGYEQVINDNFYAAAEALVQPGGGNVGVTKDRVSIDLKGGVLVYPKLTTYAILGYGGTPDVGGVRYGVGAKYDFDQFFAGVDFVHQEFRNTSTGTVAFRAGVSF